MKVLQIAVPEQLDTEMGELLQAGWFTDREEIVRLALVEFIRRYHFALLERFQREDIVWALQQKEATV